MRTATYTTIMPQRWQRLLLFAGLLAALGVEECNLSLVSIEGPADGTTFTEAQTVTITASALEGEGLTVEQVRFYRDGDQVYTDTIEPYAYRWPITAADNGTHRFYAEALYRRSDGTTELLQSAEVTYEVAINATRPQPGMGKLSGLGGIIAIALDEDRGMALVTTTQLGLALVDVRDVRRPSIVGTMAFEGNLVGLGLGQSFLYATGKGREPSSTSFYVIDIRSPASPALRGQLELPGVGGSDVVVNGDTVYVGTTKVSDPRGGLHIIDVSNPSRPSHLSTFDSYASRVSAIDDGLVLTMRSAVEMTMVDVTDPRRPRAVVHKRTAWTSAHVAGELLFGLDRVSLWIANLGNLDHWSLFSKPTLYPRDLSVQGDLVFVTTMQRTYSPVYGYEHSIVVLDIKDPRNPVTLETITPDAEVHTIAVDGPLVAAGGRDGTLVVIRR